MSRNFIALALTWLTLTALHASAGEKEFARNFSDSTLRVDYTFGADADRSSVFVDRQKSFPGWHGRRNHLDSLHYLGNGRITMTDALTGDTIYRTSFSSLFNEWLGTAERKVRPRSFQHTALLPKPLRDTNIEVILIDYTQEPIARATHKYSPTEVLVEQTALPVLPHKVLHEATYPNPIDIAILAEGYRECEMDSFYNHAQRTVDEILSYEPFRRYADRIRFVAVASPSADSGVSVPKNGEWRDTAFGSHFSTFGSDRYLTLDNLHALNDALYGIPYEHIIVLANTDEYGGGGIYNDYLLTSVGHKNFLPVIVHEFGHSFGALGDEYFYPGDSMEDCYLTGKEPWEPNITCMIDFASKWQDMLSPDTPVPTPVDYTPKKARKGKKKGAAEPAVVGVYEGAGYSGKGVFRPTPECRMRNNTFPTFCPVCERALERLILYYTE